MHIIWQSSQEKSKKLMNQSINSINPSISPSTNVCTTVALFSVQICTQITLDRKVGGSGSQKMGVPEQKPCRNYPKLIQFWSLTSSHRSRSCFLPHPACGKRMLVDGTLKGAPLIGVPWSATCHWSQHRKKGISQK